MKPSTVSILKKCERHLEEARREISVAIANYCLHYPLRSDADLIEKLNATPHGICYVVMGDSLQKECIMALSRIWDKPKAALSIDRVFLDIRKNHVLDDIKSHRSKEAKENYRPIGFMPGLLEVLPGFAQEHAKEQLRIKADEEAKMVAAKIDASIDMCEILINDVKSGKLSSVIASLDALRNQQIAHCEVDPPVRRKADIRRAQHGDEQQLLSHTIKLIEALCYLVFGDDLSLHFTIKGWKWYSAKFWLSICHVDGYDVNEIARTVDRFFSNNDIISPCASAL